MSDIAKAEREGRPLSKIMNQLTELGQGICDLWPHVRAASHIMGITEPERLAPRPRPTAEPEPPMVVILADLRDLKDWVQRVNEGLSAPLRELVPEFYKEMDDELVPKKDKEPPV